jgi:hypothetical protein
MIDSFRLGSSTIALVSITLLVACRSDDSIVKQQFSHRFTCPEDQITTTVRTDLSPVSLMTRAKPPPKDVAADPARLALWNKEQAQDGSEYEGKAVLQARGCNYELYFVCGQLKVGAGTTQYQCRDATYPPSSATAPGASASSAH